MDLGLKNKIAIVTGSSRGLGLASARALAAEGCFVALCARTADRLRQAADEVGALAGSADRVLAVQADVSSEAGVRAVIEQTAERFGGIDVLVNNVGLAGGAGLLETSDGEWQDAFDRRCRRCAPRGWRCRICNGAAAARSSSSPRSSAARQAAA
jgi:3-oxoacyl-[acyl-carrier protein] reductase